MNRSAEGVMTAINDYLCTQPGVSVEFSVREPHNTVICRLYDPPRTGYFEGWSVDSPKEAAERALTQAGW